MQELSNEKELSDEKRLDLIISDLQEIFGLDELKELIRKKKQIKIYFGTAPTGRPHIAYMIPLLKIAVFLRAGCEVTILFADLHAQLDNLKSTPELINYRTLYYEKLIKSVLRNLNVNLDKLYFVRGSSYQLSERYTMDVYKISTLVSIHDAKKAGSEVVKYSDNPKLGGLLYPILQALDEEYLGCDMTIGGTDQRKLFSFAADVLPLIGYKKRIHLMNPMLIAINAKPKLQEDNSILQEDNSMLNKMSASDNNSKIDLLDSKNEIKKKINNAYCLEGDLSFNPPLELLKMVIFPLLRNQNIEFFEINRSEKYGGTLAYHMYEQVIKDFAMKLLHPQDLKLGIIDCLNKFLEPIRQEFSTPEMIKLLKDAYPNS